MKQRLLLTFLLCALNISALFAQISNTETTITLASGSSPSRWVCQENNIASSDANNVYQVYIEYEDGDNYGMFTRLPAIGYYNCTVTNSPNGYGPNIVISVPGATFPTVNNTMLMWDLVQTKGRVFLRNTSTSVDYSQVWEYDEYRCPW
jgi:hypothetical protein